MKIEIVPVEVWPGMATHIEISGVMVSLSSGASCSYILLDDFDNALTSSSQAALTPAQYDLWGTDDDYFTGCILSNLNLTPA